MLSLAEAAAYLGYSIHGLRKIIRRGVIRYFQSKPRAAIKFTQAMLDEFIEKGTKPKVATVQKRKPKVEKQTKPAFQSTGFVDPSLFSI